MRKSRWTLDVCRMSAVPDWFHCFFVFLCAWDLFVLLMVSIDCRTAVDVRFLLVSLWTLRAWGLFVLLMVSTNGRTAVGGRVFFNHLVCCHCVHVSLYAWGLFVLLLVSTDGRSAVGERVFFITWSGVPVYWCHCVPDGRTAVSRRWWCQRTVGRSWH